MSSSNIDTAVNVLLGEFVPDPSLSHSETVQKALLIARVLQKRAQELQTPEERKQQTELDRMIQNPRDKVTLTALTDQAFRSDAAARAADQLIHILDVQGVPRFFSPMERTLLRGFQSFGGYMPGVTIPMVKDKMRRETANVIIPAEREVLSKHLDERRTEGVRMNVNFLGEAILGEEEANARLKQYLQALQLPEIEVMSVKISTIYSQITPIAREASIRPLCDRMELLYRAAAKGVFRRNDGREVPKFVYMDMEEYRDLSLTAEVFMRTLDRPGLEQVAAGIVLQAYIPDSYAWQQAITDWAKQRVEAGGAPITLRIVKGANMEMERVEASVQGWPQAPFDQKVQTDANYKRMVRYAMQDSNINAVRPGIASHNLFDISYALVMAVEQNVMGKIQFEMLEGMANHQRRALHELTKGVLLYAPACRKEDFIHAIGYLVRRLDENTGEENFLRHAFNITVDSDAWRRLEAGFLESFDLIDGLDHGPRRTQDRHENAVCEQPIADDWHQFTNEPDTDFSLPVNAEWADRIICDWIDRCDGQATEIPLFIGGQPVRERRERRESMDPSRDGVVVARYCEANSDDVKEAVRFATEETVIWQDVGFTSRRRILEKVAQEIRQARGELMGAALAEGGKILTESDPEVSEAIDFVEFYARSANYFGSMGDVTATPRGVVVVVSPWNFPIAIPCGGIAAALAAGNTVILKPASNTVLVAHLLCECFYRAGVSRKALQLLPCAGNPVGETLVTHEDVDSVILTGGTETALRMLRAKPEMRLLAETGGKNATIVTSLADRDQAIKHVLQSAFGHCGQKCSATSLLLLEEEVFHDPVFRAGLVDATRSLRVGSAWETANRLGPLVRPPGGDLIKGMKELESGESWALLPKRIDDSACVYSPGIKWNVSPGSYTHMTEFFGPVLGVMSFRSLSEAIQIVNQTGYGLTSGLESLDDREQAEWISGIRAGNLYINRSTTGAIVLRQPFGGMGRSAFGPGIKAGGPNYVAQLMRFTDVPTQRLEKNPPRIQNESLRELASRLGELRGVDQGSASRVMTAIESYDRAAEAEFRQSHDHFRLVGQDNLRRYIPVPLLVVRVSEDDDWQEIVLRAAAAQAVGCRAIISHPPNAHAEFLRQLHDITESWAADIEFVEQTDEELIEAVEWGGVSRLRYASPDRVPMSVRCAVLDRYIHVADSPVLRSGRIELMWYVQEQSICIDYHRYGNLGNRAGELRAPVR